MAETIRALFSTHRPIDRAIEKVIDYYAQAEDRLAPSCRGASSATR